MLCAKCGWNCLCCVLKKKTFKLIKVFYALSFLSPFEKELDPSFERTWLRFTQGCFVSCLVEISSMILEKIFKFRQCIFAISLLSPLAKGEVLHLNELKSSLPKNMVWPSLTWEQFLNMNSLQTDSSIRFA